LKIKEDLLNENQALLDKIMDLEKENLQIFNKLAFLRIKINYFILLNKQINIYIFMIC